MEFLQNNFISDAFLWVLRWLYTLVADYSLAIIILTVAMRAVLLPLDLRQRKSSRKMAQIQPELADLKKRYANNPQLYQKKQKELYAQEGVKPSSGCVVALIQLPIFFAFFGAMRVLASEQTVQLFLNSVQTGATELPSWLWVHNFWQPDSGFAGILPTGQEFITFLQSNSSVITPQQLSLLQQAGLISFANGNFGYVAANYDALTNTILTANNLVGYNNGWFIVPLLAGGLLFLQQKLTPQPGMQEQGKAMLYFMPIFSVFICATSNTAFAVYWMASNLYAFAQTLVLSFIEKRKYEKKKNNSQVLKEAQ